jgi:cytochrome c peroxidase
LRRILFSALCAAIAVSCTGPTDGLTDEERSIVRSLQLRTRPEDPSNRFLYDPNAINLGHALFFEPRLSGAMTVSQTGQPTKLGDGSQAAGQIACADCHSPDHFFSDDRSSPNNVSLGTGWTKRNSPALVNVGFYTAPPGQQWFAWDGQSDSLWMQCQVAYESHAAMGGDALRLAQVIESTPAYRDLIGKVDSDAGVFLDKAHLFTFTDGGSECAALDFAEVGPCAVADDMKPVMALTAKSFAAYLTELGSLDSPFDSFAAGDDFALNDQQLRGLKLFLGQAGCITCHVGPFFTDRQFHNTGLSQASKVMGVPDVDTGRAGAFDSLRKSPYGLLGPFSDIQSNTRELLTTGGYPGGPVDVNMGQFRTKSLRSVAQTAPFMHAGQLATLRDVVDFYNAGGNSGGFSGTKDELMQPLNLEPDQLDDLVAFLEALTGSPPAAELRCDPSPRDAGSVAHRFGACP